MLFIMGCQMKLSEHNYRAMICHDTLNGLNIEMVGSTGEHSTINNSKGLCGLPPLRETSSRTTLGSRIRRFSGPGALHLKILISRSPTRINIAPKKAMHRWHGRITRTDVLYRDLGIVSCVSKLDLIPRMLASR